MAVCEPRGGAAGEATLLTPCSPGEVDGDFPLLLKKKKKNRGRLLPLNLIPGWVSQTNPGPEDIRGNFSFSLGLDEI